MKAFHWRYTMAASLLATAVTFGLALPAQAQEKLLNQGASISLELGMKQLPNTSNDYKETYKDYTDDKEVKGQLAEGSVIGVTLDGTYPTLPDVTAPEGWIFIGWYDKPVYHMWWNQVNGKGPDEGSAFDTAWSDATKSYTTDPNQYYDENSLTDTGLTSGLIPPPNAITSGHYKNLRSSDPNDFNSDSWWWRRLVVSQGDKVQAGGPAKSDRLYAAYIPIQYKINYWYNGYGDQWNIESHGCLQTYRDAHTTTSSLSLSSINLKDGQRERNGLNGYKFTTWQPVGNINVSLANDGTGFNYVGYGTGQSFVVDQNLDLYAWYTKYTTGDKQEVVNTFIYPPKTPPGVDAVDLQRTDHQSYGDHYLDPLAKQEVTLRAWLRNLENEKSADPDRLAPAAYCIQWKIIEGDQYVNLTVSRFDSKYATLKTNGWGVDGQKVVVEALVYTDASSYIRKTFDFTFTHNYSDTIHYEQDPTCENGGWNYVECHYCHKARRYHIYAPLNHRWTYAAGNETATCTEDAYTEKYCVLCGSKYKTITAKAHGHDMTAEVVATCSGTVTTYKCNECGYRKSVTDANTLGEHRWSGEQVLEHATCHSSGLKGIVCLDCGLIKSSEVVPIDHSAHDYTPWQVQKAPTATTNGYETRYCKLCDVTEKSELLATNLLSKNDDVNAVDASTHHDSSVDQVFDATQKDQPTTPTTPSNPTAPSNPSSSTNPGGNLPSSPSTDDSKKGDTPQTNPVPEVTQKVTSAVSGITDKVKEQATIAVSQPDAQGNVTVTVGLKDNKTPLSKMKTQLITTIVSAAKSAHATKAELVDFDGISIDLTQKDASIQTFVKQCLEALTGSAAPMALDSAQTLKIKITDAEGAATTYTLTFVSAPKANEPQDATPNDDVAAPSDDGPTTIYRLYNEWNGAHLITADATEKDTLVSLGWTYEGEAGTTSGEGTPVYRLYNQWSYEHFFTTDYAEYCRLQTKGWKGEDVAWKASGATPMYRLYNSYATSAPNHLYTSDKNEYDSLAVKGWTQEGVAWYLS